ncbi:MAG: hypothetical protein IT186_22250 [Acidobacteria bacterium]|nr:hypothetical protein [Acidobacteriota bacterium]MCK6681122.1 hypothetical protein [Thermoanaerobaculia bacterium]
MSSPQESPDPSLILRAGLCAACRHAKLIPSPRRTYVLCRRATGEPGLEKYPVLPVSTCWAFEEDLREA